MAFMHSIKAQGIILMINMQIQDNDKIVCAGELKFHSQHDWVLFILQYSILDTIFCSVLFSIVFVL